MKVQQCQEHSGRKEVLICVQQSCLEDSRIFCQKCFDSKHIFQKTHKIISKGRFKHIYEKHIFFKNISYYQGIESLEEYLRQKITQFFTYLKNKYAPNEQINQKLKNDSFNKVQLQSLTTNLVFYKMIRLPQQSLTESKCEQVIQQLNMQIKKINDILKQRIEKSLNDSYLMFEELFSQEKNNEIQKDIKMKEFEQNYRYLFMDQIYNFNQQTSHPKLELHSNFQSVKISDSDQKYFFSITKQPFTKYHSKRYFLLNQHYQTEKQSNIQFLIGACNQELVKQSKSKIVLQNNFGYGKNTYLIYGHPNFKKIRIMSHLSENIQEKPNVALLNGTILKVEVDFENKKLKFYIGQQQIAKINLPQSNEKLFPIVGMRGYGQIIILNQFQDS